MGSTTTLLELSSMSSQPPSPDRSQERSLRLSRPPSLTPSTTLSTTKLWRPLLTRSRELRSMRSQEPSTTKLTRPSSTRESFNSPMTLVTVKNPAPTTSLLTPSPLTPPTATESGDIALAPAALHATPGTTTATPPHPQNAGDTTAAAPATATPAPTHTELTPPISSPLTPQTMTSLSMKNKPSPSRSQEP